MKVNTQEKQTAQKVTHQNQMAENANGGVTYLGTICLTNELIKWSGPVFEPSFFKISVWILDQLNSDSYAYSPP